MDRSKSRDDGGQALPSKFLNRFKFFLVFYEIHTVTQEFFEENPNLVLEYKILNYTGKYKLRKESFDI